MADSVWEIYEALILDPTNPSPNDFARDRREERAVRVWVTSERTCYIIWRERLCRKDRYVQWHSMDKKCLRVYPEHDPLRCGLENPRDIAIEHAIAVKIQLQKRFPIWLEGVAEEVAA